jgi:glycosyltransferase involved in cell wall biosynthesis
MLEPLGQSQVVAYLERLAPDWAISLISFEKNDVEGEPGRAMRARLDRVGIAWHPRRYHKRPMWLAKIADVMVGSWHAWRAAAGRGAIVHARGYLPALMALPAQRLGGAKLLFDIRGFWADERVDRGHWTRGGLEHRLAKWWERRFFAAADAVVSLTHAAVSSLQEAGLQTRPDAMIRVIPTCVDLERFAPGAKSPVLVERHRLGGATVIGCVGTMSHAYLREEMLQFIALLSRRLAARVLIVTRDDHAALRHDAVRAGIDDARLALVRASHAEMPELVRLIDIGVFFIKPSFSARASAATKLAEFLATGVPVVTTAGIGDSSDLVVRNEIGVVLPVLTPAALETGVEQALGLLADAHVRDRCRQAAEQYFDLERGVADYHALYQALSASS